MADGKLAVVLGIEVCRLFGCGQTNAEDCTDQHIETELQRYYDLGVRQITPVHIIDNAFGGAALYDEFFNAANVLINGTVFEVRDCSADGYEFRMENSAQLLGLLDLIPWFHSPVYPEGTHCNAKRITEAGRTLLRKMMDRGMIIDVDHMSAQTMNGALREAEQRCYPVISSHSGCTAITSGQLNSERLLNRELLARVHALGGLIALGTSGGDSCDTSGPHEGCVQQYGDHVKNNCNSSSRSFAQSYLFALDNGAEAVAFGTDMNGFASQASPRYGSEACNRAVPAADQDPNGAGGAIYNSGGGTVTLRPLPHRQENLLQQVFSVGRAARHPVGDAVEAAAVAFVELLEGRELSAPAAGHQE